MNKIWAKVFFKVIMSIPFLWLMIFWPANFNMNYWQGWVFFGFILIVMASALLLFKKDTALAKERMSMGKWKGVPLWEKVFWAIFIISYVALPIISALDGGRFHWSPELPVYIYVISYILFVLGVALNFWAMKTNTFFSSVVRIQKDRKQYVITTGPYAIVRHPGYTSAFLFSFPMALILGSVYGLIPATVLLVALIWRTNQEDAFLQKNLAGYKQYAKKVKYKLIPGIW